jgi:hypothetical protein
MAFFPFVNSEWARLSLSVPLTQRESGFPDDVALALLLDLTPVQIGRLGDVSAHCLRLTPRRRQALNAGGISTLGQLLECSLSKLLGLPYLGHGSVVAILDQLFFLANSDDLPALDEQDLPNPSESPGDPVPHWVLTGSRRAPWLLAAPEDLEPLTLSREWELFSGLPSCGASLLLTEMPLTEQTQRCLAGQGIVSLQGLLAQSVTELDRRFGGDIAEEVVDALTSYAAQLSLLRDPGLLFGPVRVIDQANALAERWGERQVSELKLATEALRALRRAGVVTVSELLAALDPLHVELALDPFAFAALWMTLQSVGLRAEPWEEAWARLSTNAYGAATLDHVASAWGGFLAPHRWEFVSARLGLYPFPVAEGETMAEGEEQSLSPWRIPTLEEVATKFGLTRERVRQVEGRFVDLLTNQGEDYFVALDNLHKLIIFQAGGICSLERVVADLPEWINPGQASPEGFCRLILNNSHRIITVRKNSVYALADQPHHLFRAIIDLAKEIARSRPEEIALPDLAAEVMRTGYGPSDEAVSVANPPTQEFVRACLEASGELSQGVPMLLETAMIRLLRELGGPRHFTELADRLNAKGWRKRPTAAKYIHSQLLCRRELFVYVSAGTYGLAEWGLEDVRIGRGGAPLGDLIVAFLEARGVPASQEEIVAHVRTRKNCREGSIVQRLYYDDRFCQTTKNWYGLSKWTF